MTWQKHFEDYFHFAEIQSTQKYLLEHKYKSAFCRADSQTAGVGQQGKCWHSEGGQLLFSFSFIFQLESALLSGLAQLTALTIVEALHLPELKLKWKNDLYLNQQKLGGILIDTIPCGQETLAIIGIGINLNPHRDYAGLNQMVNYSADEVLNLIMPHLLNAYQKWNQQPYLDIQNNWAKFDLFFQQKKRLLINGEEKEYLLLGIDQKGRLMVKNENKIEYLNQAQICIS